MYLRRSDEIFGLKYFPSHFTESVRQIKYIEFNILRDYANYLRVNRKKKLPQSNRENFAVLVGYISDVN